MDPILVFLLDSYSQSSLLYDHYQFGLDVHRYAEFSFPILSYAFDDDTYAPWKAVEALLAKLSNATIEIDRVQASGLGLGKIGHFGYFKEKMNETLWPRTVAWIRKISGGRNQT